MVEVLQERSTSEEARGMGMLDRTARWVDGIEEPPTGGGMLMGAPAPAEEVADGIALLEAFSNVVAFDTDEGLVLFDVSHAMSAAAVLGHLRTWSTSPVHTVVYTHGHVDHVTGAPAFDADAKARGDAPISYVAHEAVPERFDRYQVTNGYNGHINMRQFRLPAPMFPSEFVYPGTTYRDTSALTVGQRTFELHHARGETDDHTWAWLPDDRALCVGDLFIWQFPNAGNPQKVQRYAWDWAVALRHMASLEPELMLPAHGPAIGGTGRVAQVLGDTASALESLHEQTLTLMNAGARLDEVLHTVRLPADLADKPYLRASYDEPEFVVRNIWRLYGGWYDGNPANLKPAADAAVAVELAALAGGARQLAERAEAVAGSGDLRLACHLAEFAVLADPDDRRNHEVRAAIYGARRRLETSFMATGIYRAAAHESSVRLDGFDDNDGGHGPR
jgi:alkyl sulfatase BDS1-like metallo-beta-lactamase superfamily hydrolase